MSRKVIGVTVGSSLPKPNFKQTDPTKGDYIKNKPDFEGLKFQVNAMSGLVGDTSVSDQINNALTNYTEVDPTVPAWAKAENKPAYTADEVGADSSGTASSLVSAHNKATDSHSDIRNQISQLFSEKVDEETVIALIDEKLSAITNAEEVAF